MEVQTLQAAKYRVPCILTFLTGDQRCVDREIIHKYDLIELLSEHVLSPFIIYFCEWRCQRSFRDGITH